MSGPPQYAQFAGQHLGFRGDVEHRPPGEARTVEENGLLRQPFGVGPLAHAHQVLYTSRFIFGPRAIDPLGGLRGSTSRSTCFDAKVKPHMVAARQATAGGGVDSGRQVLALGQQGAAGCALVQVGEHGSSAAPKAERHRRPPGGALQPPTDRGANESQRGVPARR